jgi:hypothetical protein
MDLLSWSGPELGMNNALKVRIDPTNTEWHEISTGKTHLIQQFWMLNVFSVSPHRTSFECWMSLWSHPFYEFWMLNAFADNRPIAQVLNVECLCRHTPIAQVLNVECLCRHTPIAQVLNVECLCRHTPIAQVLNVECLCRHTHSTSFYCW